LHIEAGCLRLHPVSVPNDAGTSHAATLAEEPELDHHGILFVHHGFIVFSNAEFSPELHIANSSIFTFQIELTHALFNFSTKVAL
jgi:hypothetical protein